MMRLTSFIALVAPAVGFHLAVRPLTTRLSIRMEEEDDGRRGFGVAFSGDDEAIKRDAKLVFAVLDKSGDGEVDRKELSEHLTKAGHAQDQVDAWFGALDADGSGSISQDEFAQAYLEYPGMREYPGLGASDDGDIPQAIRMDATNFIAAVDNSRDGAVSSAELEAHMTKLGFTSEAIEHVFAQLDLDASGELSRDEIAEVFLKYSALRLALRK